MALLYAPKPYTKESRHQAVKLLLENSVPDRDFYLLLIAAIMLAASGILTDSLPVLIASMVVAPLASPILSLGLGILARDRELFLRSLGMLLVSIVLALSLAGVFSLLVQGALGIGERVLVTFFPNIFFDILIAVISGCLAAYGLMRSKVRAAATGVGIAVSLLAPLVATGIGLFTLGDELAWRAGSIFLYNVIGVLAGSMLTFLVFDIHEER